MMNNSMRRILSEKENRTQAEQNAYVKFALQTEKLHKKLDRKEKYSYDDTYLPETDVNMLFDWYEAKMLKDDLLTKRIGLTFDLIFDIIILNRKRAICPHFYFGSQLLLGFFMP